MAAASAARSIRRNDTVLVLAGKSKGRTGRVLRVFPAEGRAIVEGVNFVRKHTKANPQKNIKGGILERDAAVDQLAAITGQRPVIRRARKSIANFKIRKGMPIGCTVTLRGDRMYDFFDRLVTIALPRVRDFRGLPTRAFDGRGNYTLGLKDQLVFLEVNYTKVDKVHGMNVTIVTTAETDEESKNLLTLLGLPFRRD